MAKKKKKRRKTARRDTTVPTPPVEKGTAPPAKKKEATSKKDRKRIFLYIIPLVIITTAILLFILSRTEKPGYGVSRDSELNVLLITLDTTRADRVGVYGNERAKTPHLDALAREGVMFKNAYCQVPLTLPSHVSILTGTYPVYHHVHNNGFYYLNPDLVTLAEVFQRKGFKTAAFVASYSVDSSFGLDKGFDFYDDSMAEEELLKTFRSERTADKVYESFTRWLEKNRTEKFFSWIHFFDPHTPYLPPSPFKEEFAARPYEGEIAFMDFYVGQVVADLKEKDLFDRTLILLAGDHGEAIGDHGEADHGLFLYESTMRIPFIIYAKNHLSSGRVVDSAVRLIDIMPSLLDMVKIPVPGQVQGESLLPYISGTKKGDLPSYIETVYPRENYGWSELSGLIDGGWKFILAPKPELYNLIEDPAEEVNLIEREGQRVRGMKEKMEKLIAESSSELDARRKSVSQEELARLRSLGYVGGGTAVDSGDRLPDPKDRKEEYNKLFQARQHEWSGHFSLAAEIYEEILGVNPEFEWNYINLARAYTHLDKMEDGIALLEEARRRKPDAFIILSTLAAFYAQANKQERAFEVSQAALRFDPQFLAGWIISGVTKFNQGRYKEAAELFERALEIEPENKSVRIKYAYIIGALGRTEEALEIYSRLQEEYPEEVEVVSGLGLIFSSLGNFDKAEGYLKKAVELDPTPENHLKYSAIMEMTGNLKEAIRYIKLYLEATPEGETPQKIKAKQALAEWEKQIKSMR